MKPEDTGNTQPTSPPPVTPPTPETPSSPATPVTPTPSATPNTQGISEDQVASLKDSITKDVSGKVTQEVSKGVLQKIADALGLNKEEKEELPTNPQQLQKVVDKAIQDKFSKLTEDAQKEEEGEKAAREERINNTIRGWHYQYNEMANLNKVPLIKNPNDENDTGVQARRKIILAIGKIIKENHEKDPENNYAPTVSDVLVRWPNILKEPPGADLPISGNTAVRQNEDSFNYHDDIHNKTFSEIVDENQ